eukprot:3594777-Pyramimonas_sp.AAC.3
MPPAVFMTQIYSLTGVPIDRQKIMVKGGMLKVTQFPLMLSLSETVPRSAEIGPQSSCSVRASCFRDPEFEALRLLELTDLCCGMIPLSLIHISEPTRPEPI